MLNHIHYCPVCTKDWEHIAVVATMNDNEYCGTSQVFCCSTCFPQSKNGISTKRPTRLYFQRSMMRRVTVIRAPRRPPLKDPIPRNHYRNLWKAPLPSNASVRPQFDKFVEAFKDGVPKKEIAQMFSPPISVTRVRELWQKYIQPWALT